MTQQKRPAWIENAAQAVTEAYFHQQEGVEHAKEGVERAREHVQASGARLKTNIQEGIERAKEFVRADIRQAPLTILNFVEPLGMLGQIGRDEPETWQISFSHYITIRHLGDALPVGLRYNLGSSFRGAYRQPEGRQLL